MCGITYAANEVKVMQYRYSGPYRVNPPILSDSLNVNGKAFEAKNLLKSSIDFDKVLNNTQIIEADTAGTITFDKPESGNALYVFSFFLNSDRFTKGNLAIEGPGNFEVYLDNKSIGKRAEVKLEPRRYEVRIKYLTLESDTCKPNLKAIYKTETDAQINITPDKTKRFTMRDFTEGLDFSGISLSPNGKFALIKLTNRMPQGKSESYSQLYETSTGRVLLEDNGFLRNARWMPASNLLYFTRTGTTGTELVTVDPADFRQTILVSDLPKGNFRFTPDEKTLLFTVQEDGPAEGKELVRVINPNDRIPGYRNRSFIWRYDLSSGLFEQLTYGHNSTRLNDVSFDSRYLLFSTSEQVYTSLPHGRNSLYKLDLQTLEVDTLWEGKKYVSGAAFSPDAKQLMVFGSGNAFDNIGLNILDGQISNTYDNQLFLYDLTTRKAKALTKDFDPSVTGAVWSKNDKHIYILGEDKDYQRLFTCNPQNGQIRQLDTAEDVILSWSLAETMPLLYYYGQSVSNANRLYAYDLKKGKSKLVYDVSADKLKDIRFGKVEDWNFLSEDGTNIQGRYYLPPSFDPGKKYPMIVYYYGGTSPTNRMLESRYSPHMYAALGYVVYTLNPSGTTGFGQEFSARHVNAWGIRTAEEIIRGTEKFCEEHAFVDKKKIGCIGASYGGFMTQYLQTKTDLFAAAVSHAGISALSSYWGEGYWGYGYCSVANTGTYPWNNPEFYTEQSPLFHADKIQTPLLLLHGNADTNVPVGESIQMFAALKLLGKNVEFIQVDGENHGIVGYTKRIGWQNSIFAWFAKWLKDQPEWWEELYPKRSFEE